MVGKIVKSSAPFQCANYCLNHDRAQVLYWEGLDIDFLDAERLAGRTSPNSAGHCFGKVSPWKCIAEEIAHNRVIRIPADFASVMLTPTPSGRSMERDIDQDPRKRKKKKPPKQWKGVLVAIRYLLCNTWRYYPCRTIQLQMVR